MLTYNNPAHPCAHPFFLPYGRGLLYDPPVHKQKENIMLAAARIQATIDCMTRILAAPIPMDGVTGDYFRHRKYIGSKDRADIAERVYSVMRHYARLTWWCEKLDTPVTADTLVLLYLRLVENFSTKKFHDLYDGDKYSPLPITPEQDAILAKLDGAVLEPDDMPERVRVECPPEYEDRLRAQYGDKFADELSAMMTGATLDLRINGLKITREQAIKSLSKDGVAGSETPYSPWGIRLERKAFLSETKAFREGFVEIQDEGSQLISYVCDAKPGLQVLDYCAGAGGKTLALAGAMRNKGRIVAMDIESSRLEKSRLRFRRAGAADIIEVRPLSDEQHRKWLRRQKGTFDVTLIDAPCSGSGTWRRNPDQRFRAFGPPLEETIKVQSEILDKVAQTVKPGGKLVYATCSIFAQENEDQITAFLAKHPEFKVAPLKSVWPSETPVPCEGDFMRLTPLRHNTDGFFAAVLVKQEQAEVAA